MWTKHHPYFFRYNLTVQLRSKIDGLGNLLLGMGAARRKVPWPTWFNDFSGSQFNRNIWACVLA